MKPARDEGVVKLMVEVLKPYRGRLYDPLLASSSGMFVQSVEFGGIGRRLAHGIV